MKITRLGILLLLLLFAVTIQVVTAEDQLVLPPLESAVDSTPVEPASDVTPADQTIEPVSISVAPAEYRIQEDDVMRITVWGEPNLATDQMVDPKGYINVPEVGQILVKGLTQQELVDKIEQGLMKILVEPKVSLTMTMFHKPKVQMTGQFNRPGQFEFKPGSRVMDAVALAGSFTDIADLEGAKLTHKDSTESIPLNLKDIYAKGNLSGNIVLQDGDTIYLPEDVTNWYFVVGQVGRPGKYRLKENVTLVDAVSTAGFLERASKKSTYVIRGEVTPEGKKVEDGTGKSERIKCDLDALFKKADMSQNIALLPGDVVYVPETSKLNIAEIGGYISAIVNGSYMLRLLGF